MCMPLLNGLAHRAFSLRVEGFLSMFKRIKHDHNSTEKSAPAKVDEQGYPESGKFVTQHGKRQSNGAQMP